MQYSVGSTIGIRTQSSPLAAGSCWKCENVISYCHVRYLRYNSTLRAFLQSNLCIHLSSATNYLSVVATLMS